jgi:hypothetical protein
MEYHVVVKIITDSDPNNVIDSYTQTH